MWHLDIPKTRQYDNGKVEVVARNSAGESVCETTLTVKPREDDYRGVLKNSPRRKLDRFIQVFLQAFTDLSLPRYVANLFSFFIYI